MNFNFSPEDLMLRDMLRRFVQREAQPLESKFFVDRELSTEEYAHLRQGISQLGLWGVMTPEEYGGGLELVTTCLIEEELGKTFIPVELGDVSPLLYECSRGQVDQYLNPALQGDRRAIIAAREPGRLLPETWTSTADRLQDDYLLNGCKCLARSPAPEDFIIFFARVRSGLTAFLLDASDPHLRIEVDGELLLIVENCPVGTSAILGEQGGALRLGIGEGPREWIRTGARYLGIAHRLLEMAVAHARDWISHGAPLAGRPAIQRLLAEIRVDLDAARWLVYHAAWLADEGKPVRGAAAQVRLFTGEMLQRVINRTTMVYTGPAQWDELRVFTLAVTSSGAFQSALEHARAAVAREILASPESGSESI